MKVEEEVAMLVKGRLELVANVEVNLELDTYGVWAELVYLLTPRDEMPDDVLVNGKVGALEPLTKLEVIGLE